MLACPMPATTVALTTITKSQQEAGVSEEEPPSPGGLASRHTR